MVLTIVGPSRPKYVVNVVLEGEPSPPLQLVRSNVFLVEGHARKKIKSDPINTITFSYEDYGVIPGHNDVLVLTLDMADQDVMKVLVDKGSSVDILYYHAFNRMLLDGYQLEKGDGTPLYEFGNNAILVRGTITLAVIFGTEPAQIGTMVKFYVVDGASSYNAIIGRPTLANLRAVTSTSHMKIKFLTPYGIGEMKASPDISKTCYSRALSLTQTTPKEKEDKGKAKAVMTISLPNWVHIRGICTRPNYS